MWIIELIELGSEHMCIKHLRIIAPEMKNTRVDSKTRVITSAAWKIGVSNRQALIGVPVSLYRNSSKCSVADGVITALLPAEDEHGEKRFIIKAKWLSRDSKWLGSKSNGSALVYEYQ